MNLVFGLLRTYMDLIMKARLEEREASSAAALQLVLMVGKPGYAHKPVSPLKVGFWPHACVLATQA